MITMIPQPHGDHVHVGQGTAANNDANGLWNANAWRALDRKGLINSNFPMSLLLTEAGRDYETGLRQQILHGLPEET